MKYSYRIKDFDSIVKYMNSMEFSGMKLGLSRIQEALKLFGNPEKRLKIIHVGGTNGKGSTAAMIAKIIELSGKKAGLYTSPHLVEVRERIQINSEMITKDGFRDVFNEAREKMAELTFFELMTLMAVLYFVKQKVDYAVFEVGLGGRLDATNFDDAEISVLTRIDLDHTNILGNTVEEIALDKCAIIKPRKKVFTTVKNDQVMDIIRKVAGKKAAGLVVCDKTIHTVGLLGDFQKENAGIAEAVTRELGVEEDIIARGLEAVNWPGRIEYLEPRVLMDCAHNPVGIRALADFVRELDYDELVVVFAVTRNKDYKIMIEELPKHKELVCTQTSVERRVPVQDLDCDCKKFEDPIEALEHAKSRVGPEGLVLVCGSIFLVGDLKSVLSKQ